MVIEAAITHLDRRGFDGVGACCIQCAETTVGARRGNLLQTEGVNEAGWKTLLADIEYRELFATMGASRAQEFAKLRIPYCMPYFFSALKISASLAVIGAIVGEFVGSTQGLGYLIVISSAHLETPTLFTAIIGAALIGIVLFYAIGWAERRLVFWSAGDAD